MTRRLPPALLIALLFAAGGVGATEEPASDLTPYHDAWAWDSTRDRTEARHLRMTPEQRMRFREKLLIQHRSSHQAGQGGELGW